MASQFAKSLSENLEQTATRYSEIEAIDAELSEVREVLRDFLGFLNVTPLRLNEGDSMTLSMIIDRARKLADKLKVED